MKRLTAMILPALMVFTLGGCAMLYTAYDSAIPDTLTRGTIEDNAYTSAYAGIVFNAPEGWEYATDEELATLMNLSAEALGESGPEITGETLKRQSVYDMMATDATTGEGVMLLYENLALTGNTAISETEYLGQVKNSLEQAQNARYEFGDISEEEFCGQTCYSMTAALSGYDAMQHYIVRKMDKYMLCIVVSALSGDNIPAITGCFSAYEVE